MAVACKLIIGATTIYPELPIDYELIPIVEDRRQLNGTMRRVYRGTKLRATMRLTLATEAERAAWAAAVTFDTSLTFTDEAGVARTVLLMAWRAPLSKTEPAVEGGTNTTGPGYYDVEITVEQV
jgi:hypothetical protein